MDQYNSDEQPDQATEHKDQNPVQETKDTGVYNKPQADEDITEYDTKPKSE